MLESNMTPNKKILFKITGSIACYKSCSLISKLIQNRFEVQVVASPAALKFIGQTTLEGLTSRPVISDLWQSGQVMSHIHLMRWADLIIVSPATGNFINKVAHGVGDDLLTTLFLAHDFKKPYLIAPAMNTAMYMHPITQSSLKSLKELGIKILETASGVLACGESGYGKLLEPDLIYNEILSAFAETSKLLPPNNTRPTSLPRKVLITSGGTQEPIDQVRFIANRSTGTTGATIADALIEAGIEVTYLHASSAKLPFNTCNKISFNTFTDLQVALFDLLQAQKFDALIHAAAVSDYSLAETPAVGKISSAPDQLVLKLKKNIKLVDQVQKISQNKDIVLVAFKMTANPAKEIQEQAVSNLFQTSHAKLVVHNDMSEMNWSSGKHLYHWCLPDKKFIDNFTIANSQDLAIRLSEFIYTMTEKL